MKTTKKCNSAFTVKIFIGVVFLCIGFRLATLAQQKKDLVMGFSPNPRASQTSWAGRSTADVRAMFQVAADEFKKANGYGLSLKIFPGPKFMLKAFQQKEADLGAMSVGLFVLARRQNVSIKPLLSVSSAGGKNEKFCVYVHKKSGIKNIQQLQGKRYITDFPLFLSRKDVMPPKESYMEWVFLKRMLAAQNINKPLKSFFKELKVAPIPWESVAYSVVLRQYDAFHTYQFNLNSLKSYDKTFSDLAPVACIDANLGPLVVRKDISADVVNKLLSFIHNPPQNKETADMLKQWKATKAKIYNITATDFDVYELWLQDAEKKGWVAEFEALMKEAGGKSTP